MLDRIRAGDELALRQLLREEWPGLVRYLATMADSADAAHDAAQEAFIRLWEKREGWTGVSTRALLIRIGRNIVLDQKRQQAVRTRWARDPASKHHPPVITPADDLEHTELVTRIDSALAELAPRRREVFRLVRFDGLSYDEVAEVMGVSRQTVANQMSRALTELRSALTDAASDTPAQTGPQRERNDG